MFILSDCPDLQIDNAPVLQVTCQWILTFDTPTLETGYSLGSRPSAHLFLAGKRSSNRPICTRLTSPIMGNAVQKITETAASDHLVKLIVGPLVTE